MEDTLQPQDDLPLLERMMSDLAAAPEAYRPTRYWAGNQQEMVDYLRKYGLCEFRRRHSTGARNILLSFGATDLLRDEWAAPQLERSRLLNNRATRRLPHADKALSLVGEQWRRRYLRHLSGRYDAYGAACLAFAAAKASQWGARPPGDLVISLVGSPEDVFHVNGRAWSYTMLNFYMRYAWTAQFVDFASLSSVAELGSGSGKQAEVLAALYPDLTLYLFDIPPQLYVAHQYLRSVFPERVVPYGEAVSAEPGRINLLPAWTFPRLPDITPELFWNAASFQEMEPDVVANYLSIVQAAGPRSVYLFELMDGLPTGVREPTTVHHYADGLPGYTLASMEPSLLADGRPEPGYSDSYWRRSTS